MNSKYSVVSLEISRENIMVTRLIDFFPSSIQNKLISAIIVFKNRVIAVRS